MSDLPAIWTLLPGVIAGLLFIGRIARWLQFVISVRGRPSGHFAANPHPRPWKTVAAIVLYPTPWIALTLTVWAIHHLVSAPFTPQWRWFYAGFLGGPLLTTAYMYVKISRLRARRRAATQILTAAATAPSAPATGEDGRDPPGP